MKNRLVIKALVMLGFGVAAGFASSCGANRAQKSRPSDAVSPADSITVPGGEAPVRVMYGVPPARFDKNRPVREMEGSVSGRVTDENGEPLIGTLVYVMPETSRIGAISGPDGLYSIDAGTGDKLRFSYLGYIEQTVEVKGDTLDVGMKADTVLLNKVITVAYGPRPANFDKNKPVEK